MALFNFRKRGEEPRAPAGPGESIEAMRRRARHRLIGAAVLVLAGVIGFPLLFDTQPRPVAMDIPIEIPDRNKVPPLAPLAREGAAAAGKVVAAAPAAGSEAAEAAPAPAAAPVVATAAATDAVAPAPGSAASANVASPHVASASAATSSPAGVAAEPADAAAASRPAAPAPAKSRPEDEAARARALLEGKPVETTVAAANERFVVQVGAFAEQPKARDARMRLERAGIKTYTQVAETSAGRRIRVRAGPFSSRAEAEQAAEKIKGLDLPAAILTL